MVRQYFTAILGELNALPDQSEMIVEYYAKASKLIASLTLSDNLHDMALL